MLDAAAALASGRSAEARAALADGAFDVIAEPSRTNRSTQHWLIEIRQGGETVLTGTALTALRRETWGTQDEPAPRVLSPNAIGKPNMAPLVEWVKRYDIRITEGAIPTAWDGGGDASRTTLWMRDEPARPLDFCSLAAMADVFYPRVWLRRATRVPAGTVSMTVYFHAGSAQLAAAGAGPLSAIALRHCVSSGNADVSTCHLLSNFYGAARCVFWENAHFSPSAVSPPADHESAVQHVSPGRRALHT